MSREQAWLLPPSLDDLIPMTHPARFVAEFVDSLGDEEWGSMGVELEDPLEGAPAYHPRALLSVWVYGFMTGVRSCRKLEGACRDQVPYLWLTGWQHPDHNTLWRFYRQHRQGMRRLLKKTVRTAVVMGLVDLAVQAVDGTKIAANASKHRTYDAKELVSLLKRTEAAIAQLETQNEGGEDPPPPQLPQELAEARALRERVRGAIRQLEAEGEQGRINLTDRDAKLMKTRQGFVAGYNAQAMVSPLDSKRAGGTGLLITAAEVVTDAEDHGQLVPMMEAAKETRGVAAAVTLADAGYHSGANLQACADRGGVVVMPESGQESLTSPYHKQHFTYDAALHSYTCPRGQVLSFKGIKRRRGELPVRVYQGNGVVCRSCPAFGKCTTNRQGRVIETGLYEDVLREHRTWMATQEATELYRQRRTLPEPTFGILKEQQGARHFLLRGGVNVAHEWALLASSFNLRTLWKAWANQGAPRAWWAVAVA